MKRVAAALLLVTGAAHGGPASPAPCAAAEMHQFDFWAGRWQVSSADGRTTLGASEVEAVAGGCALHEHWHGSKGAEGESLNIYDAASGHWHQTWVDNSGALLQLDGGLVGKAMVLENVHGPAAARVTERITWTPLPDGRVNQRWETIPAGKPATISFDGYYRRRAETSGASP
ncbi:hypothetical protein [Solimonas terrae]|uniref:DUF1579 domain-containing protein n=1 Tax=Solimonas terrae TaxID=1396819 RepID=A0A6M2BSQ0_9GAMM|nr:hypothetical protein [Solimonas terrae]NGY05384.1 hypothetical protein [Solimonas terrae]